MLATDDLPRSKLVDAQYLAAGLKTPRSSVIRLRHIKSAATTIACLQPTPCSPGMILLLHTNLDHPSSLVMSLGQECLASPYSYKNRQFHSSCMHNVTSQARVHGSSMFACSSADLHGAGQSGCRWGGQGGSGEMAAEAPCRAAPVLLRKLLALTVTR